MSKDTAGSMPLDAFIAAAVRDISTGLARASRDVISGRSEPVVVGFDLAVVVRSNAGEPVISVVGDMTAQAAGDRDGGKKKKKKKKGKKAKAADTAVAPRGEVRPEVLSRLRFSLPLSLHDADEMRKPAREAAGFRETARQDGKPGGESEMLQPQSSSSAQDPMRRRNLDPGTYGLA